MSVKQWSVIGLIAALAAVVVIVGLLVQSQLPQPHLSLDNRTLVLEWIDDNYNYSGVEILKWDEKVLGHNHPDVVLAWRVATLTA